MEPSVEEDGPARGFPEGNWSCTGPRILVAGLSRPMYLLGLVD